jgi:hypothetical protein
LEQAFRGRTVTMPAFHYDTGSLEDREKLNRLTSQWRKNGFRYIIAICGQPSDLPGKLDVDLIIQPTNQGEVTDVEKIRKSVADLWRQPSRFQ